MLGGVPDALPPGARRDRRLEAAVAQRRLGERDAVEGDERVAVAGEGVLAGYFT